MIKTIIYIYSYTYYVFIYICIIVCTYIYTYIYVNICICICIRLHVQISAQTCVCICMLPVSQYVMRSMCTSQLALRNIYGHTNRIYIHIRYKLADKWTDKQLDTERKR